MKDERLLTISTFSRAVGIPASALRFYASEGVLVPAEVDPFTSYRYYAPTQIDAGLLMAQLRSAGVPVPVMRDIVEAPKAEAIRLIDTVIASQNVETRRRELDLTALRESLRDAERAPQASRAWLPGPVLASAIRQVSAATAEAAEEVSGVVWALQSGHLELVATDRYWLVHRELRLTRSEGTGRVMTTSAAADDVVVACAERSEVEVEISEGRLRLLDAQSAVLTDAGAAERDVPDLSLLVSTQPPRRAVVGFDSAALAEFLCGPAADGPIQVDVGRAMVVDTDGDRLCGWSSVDAVEAENLRIQMQPTLLASAVSVCPGHEVLLGLVDGGTPVRVQSPHQDAMTCLVMPMRP